MLIDMHIAHRFTVLRVILIPLFPLVYLENIRLHIPVFYVPYLLLFILTICELSDFFDGYLARKKHLVSDLGKIIDPLADTITHMLVFFTFTQGVVKVPLLLVFVMLYREFLVSALRTLSALKGIAFAARKSGKAKTFLNGVVCFFIVILLIPYSMKILSIETLQLCSLIAVSLASFISVLTGIEYIFANREMLKKFF